MTKAGAFAGFTQQDFDVFGIPGLEPRMEALISRVRPKLEQLGELVAPVLAEQCGEPMFAHVAKHARRTVNPPDDTWVAFAHNRRGYKAHPHFQIGLFGTHLFVQFAMIYEADHKAQFAAQALRRLTELRRHVPAHYVWSGDHTVPGGQPHGEMKRKELEALLQRLRHVKASEVLCGLQIDAGDELLRDGPRLLETIEQTFATLQPLYRMAL
ncbi:DUF1054 domain-containing protein [Paenibacillus sp. IB182496]|uniref:UPF0637 protein IDH44_13580 n=2 Tax=Paenibacillus sabuli TaxID=2772509 RepID=A0A927BTW9_9BACL|nr:DUF1054 domain-containing protein [Paenibacillus sabuli]